MAKRRPSTAALILGLVWSSPGLAQYMVLTHPETPAGAPAETPAETPRAVAAPRGPLPPVRPTARVLDGELPHQRTGPKRERVVRDICIGCDR